jgi:hypothetical protein
MYFLGGCNHNCTQFPISTMSTNTQALTSALMPFFLAIRVISDAIQEPAVNLYGFNYADEPPGWAREDYVQPEPYFDQNGNEIQRHEWIYASAVFSLAPYTHSVKVTVRCWDDPNSYTRLCILAADEHKHMVKKIMQEDIDHCVDTEIQKPDGQEPRLIHEMIGTTVRTGIQDAVTGRRFVWFLLEMSASNPRAHPVGRRTPQEEREWERERQQNMDPDKFGRVDEDKNKILELHGGLDLVEVDMEVEEEEKTVRVRREPRVKAEEVKMEVRIKPEVKLEETE